MRSLLDMETIENQFKPDLDAICREIETQENQSWFDLYASDYDMDVIENPLELDLDSARTDFRMDDLTDKAASSVLKESNGF